MSFFVKTSPPDNEKALEDALISLSSNDMNTYVSISALRNSDIFAAVNIIASDIASNPIECGTSIYESMLNRKPNKYMDGFHFKYALALNMLLNGNSFAEIKPNHTLKFIPNSQMTVTVDDESGQVTYTYSPNGRTKREIAPDNILHFRYLTKDGIAGVSPLYALKDEQKIQKAGNELITGFFSKGVHGTNLIKVHETDLSPKAKENIRNSFDSATSGENSLHSVVIDDGMDVSNLQINTDVLKLVNSNDWTTKQIAKAFGLDPSRLGVEAVHSNQDQTSAQYLKDTLQHYLDCFTSELSFKFGKEFKFNTNNLLSLDPKEQQEMATEAYTSGIVTRNEARQKMGLEPVIDGNNFYEKESVSSERNKNEPVSQSKGTD